MVKRPVVKRPVVKRPVVKAPATAPAPKPHPFSPQVQLAPTSVLPASRTGGSAFVTVVWVPWLAVGLIALGLVIAVIMDQLESRTA